MRKIVCNSMLYMIFQKKNSVLVLIQGIIICFEAILELKLQFEKS